MKSPVISVNPGDSVQSVAQVLARKKIHGVPVVEEGRLLGIITETDFFVKETFVHIPSYIDFLNKTSLHQSFEKEKSKKINKIVESKAKDIMSSPCITVSPEDSLEKVFKLFKKTKFATLPVTDKRNSLVGVVTISDVIQLISLNFHLH